MISIILPFFTKINGEVHHVPRYERYPALAGRGVLPNQNEESERIFSTLVGRNAINLHSHAHAVGFVYRSDTPETIQAKIGALVHGVEVST
mgnify:CR=1 FL=1